MGSCRTVKWIGCYTAYNGRQYQLYGDSQKQIIYNALVTEGNKNIRIFAYQQMRPSKNRTFKLNEYEIVQTAYGPEARKKSKKDIKKSEVKTDWYLA